MPNHLLLRALSVCAAFGLIAACSAEQDPLSVSTADPVATELSTTFSLPTSAGSSQVSAATVGPAKIWSDLKLPGSIGFNEERRATIAAGLDGVVNSVDVRLGDKVKAGTRLAVVASRDLARSRVAYIEAAHHLEYSITAFEREQALWDKKITAEESYLSAQHDVEEARLGKLTAAQELIALGSAESDLALLINHDEGDVLAKETADLANYERYSPLDGTVVSRDVVLGEVLHGNQQMFEIADLSVVWVSLRVQAAQFTKLAVGASVTVESADLGKSSEATVAYLDPRVDRETQTGFARIELANKTGEWRPGLYVTVNAKVGQREVALAIPRTSLHRFPGNPGEPETVRVFVVLGNGRFEAREVQLGTEGTSHVEVLEGLAAGERVAIDRGPLLKSVWLGGGGFEE